MVRLDKKGFRQAEEMKNKGDKTALELLNSKDDNKKLLYKIVERHGKPDVVDLYDTVKLYYENLGEEEITVLTGNYMPESMDETTLNSPVGSAIYGQPKGAKVTCNVNGIEHEIVIRDFTKFVNVNEDTTTEVKATDEKTAGLK